MYSAFRFRNYHGNHNWRFPELKIEQPYVEGRLIKRYKRFLADVELANGEVITAHTPNTGAMLGCAEPGSRVWLYDTGNPKRKYLYSWDLVEDLSGNLVGIHTTRANKLVHEAIEHGVIPELQGYSQIQSEVKFHDSNTRFDFFLSGGDQTKPCYLEVKSVTAKRNNATAIFPDAVSIRGKKHLIALVEAIQRGYDAVIFFCIQREDVQTFSPASEIDPEYTSALNHAIEAGVQVLAYKVKISPTEIVIDSVVPVQV